MATTVEVDKVRSVGEFYVEVDGPDGLKHHMGPFKSHSLAQAWIARQSFASEAVPSVRRSRDEIASEPPLKTPP